MQPDERTAQMAVSEDGPRWEVYVCEYGDVAEWPRARIPWRTGWRPPTVVDRAFALWSLGWEPANQGDEDAPDGWTWQEKPGKDGQPLLFCSTTVRQLSAPPPPGDQGASPQVTQHSAGI